MDNTGRIGLQNASQAETCQALLSSSAQVDGRSPKESQEACLPLSALPGQGIIRQVEPTCDNMPLAWGRTAEAGRALQVAVSQGTSLLQKQESGGKRGHLW